MNWSDLRKYTLKDIAEHIDEGIIVSAPYIIDDVLLIIRKSKMDDLVKEVGRSEAKIKDVLELLNNIKISGSMRVLIEKHLL